MNQLHHHWTPGSTQTDFKTRCFFYQIQTTQRLPKWPKNAIFRPWWLWPSNSSERGTKRVFRVKMAQICSAVPEIFHTQTKNTDWRRQKQNFPQLTARGNYWYYVQGSVIQQVYVTSSVFMVLLVHFHLSININWTVLAFITWPAAVHSLSPLVSPGTAFHCLLVVHPSLSSLTSKLLTSGYPSLVKYIPFTQLLPTLTIQASTPDCTSYKLTCTYVRTFVYTCI